MERNEKSNGQLLVEGGAFKEDDLDLFDYLEQEEESQEMRIVQI